MNQNHEFQNESEKNNKAMIFYILAALLLLYMGMSAITSYQSLAAYCDNYGLNMSEQWFLGFQTILAAIVPCLVYAALLYGIGLLLDKK